MKIAILTSGVLPVPAVQGGAVENLLDAALAYNDLHHLHDITVVSAYHPNVQQHPALSSAVNHYLYIDRQSRLHRLMAKVYGKLHQTATTTISWSTSWSKPTASSVASTSMSYC